MDRRRALLLVATATYCSCFQAPLTSSLINRKENPSSNSNAFRIQHHAAVPTTETRQSATATLSTETNKSNPLSFLANLFPATNPIQQNPVQTMLDAWNQRDLDTVMAQFDQQVQYEDSSFPGPFANKDTLERHLRLLADCNAQEQWVLDFMVVSSEKDKVAIQYHLQDATTDTRVPNSRHHALYTLNQEGTLITSVFDTKEPANKPGSTSLKILNGAGKIIEAMGGSRSGDEDDKDTIDSPTAPVAPMTPPERYFAAWNKRDMEAAVNIFTDDCTYDDTVFERPFQGKEPLFKHLQQCADAFPPTFRFIVDDICQDVSSGKLAVQWHIENKGEQLPFTRGLSFYQLDGSLIRDGVDMVEPAVFKLGGPELFIKSLVGKFKEEPYRVIPVLLWFAYMYVVFISDGILPGANALQLEQRTWEEVRDLSINFFLVSPLLNLPFAATVHPILEGVFNLLLSWAAMFVGFLSDERKDKPNLLPMLPTVVGMQFLTSAFLLPYLALRTTEKNDVAVTTQDLDFPARVVESRALGPFLGLVGAGSFAWGTLARVDDFGGWSERVASFSQLISIDRVGSSFLVDLVIFALFQGWLVDDDLRRRGVAPGECLVLRNVAKYVPFFGMAAYMTLRPSYADNDSQEAR